MIVSQFSTGLLALRRRWSVVLPTLLLASSAFAQTTSVIEGTVTNPNGEALSGVSIVATGATLERSMVTDARGRYRIPALPAGTYKVSASLEGFATETVEDVSLALNSTAVIDLALEIGTVQEAVTVTAELPLIQPNSSDTGGIITPEQIETLPVNGRDYLDLMQLVPGVTVNRQSDPGSDSSTPVLGERAGNTVYLIDGMPNRDEFGSGPSSQFNQDTIFEFEVITDGYKAEFGHGSGGVVNVVSQSGGNSLKGLGFLFVRDDSLDSSNSLDETIDDAPALDRYDFGFTVGGALIKDRLFLFASAESIDEDRQLNFAFPEATPE